MLLYVVNYSKKENVQIIVGQMKYSIIMIMLFFNFMDYIIFILILHVIWLSFKLFNQVGNIYLKNNLYCIIKKILKGIILVKL